jgi:EAL domain-containing protein (putative c-di-GMP-specific phosphodiesterase class I)
MPGPPDAPALDWPALLAEVCADPARVRPAFQPIVDLRRGVVCGYEALTRFESEAQASPLQWFGAAALYGRASQLEALALRAVLDARRDLPPACFLSLNVSPEALASDEVAGVLLDAGDLAGIVIEVTEQTPVEDYVVLRRRLDGLRASGASVAIDDAGAGYSSLSHILALEPQYVKLDRSLVTDVDLDARCATAVSAIAGFAGRLDATVVAEGVERPGALERLMALGVPLAQGYLLAKPAPMFGGVAPAAKRLLRAAVGGWARVREGSLGSLVESVPTVALGQDARDDRCTVTVDEHGCPEEVLAREPNGRRRIRGAAMRVLGCERPADVATRAIARSEAERFLPVTCCDEQGRLVGIVRLERLVETLAAGRDA